MVIAAPSEIPALYRATRKRIDIVDVPELAFASVDGHGKPGGPEFADALSGLYPIAYGIRFALRALGVEEPVSPLEALWWGNEPAGDFAAALARGRYRPADMDAWSWRVMIRLPRVADEELVARVREEAIARHPGSARRVTAVRFATWREGLSAQTLHLGPYEAELPTVARLHRAIAELGYRRFGRHHEIYLGDPRRCTPERLRTILRQPVIPLDGGS